MNTCVESPKLENVIPFYIDGAKDHGHARAGPITSSTKLARVPFLKKSSLYVPRVRIEFISCSLTVKPIQHVPYLLKLIQI